MDYTFLSFSKSGFNFTETLTIIPYIMNIIFINMVLLYYHICWNFILRCLISQVLKYWHLTDNEFLKLR
jgi:hypothetical protein